MFETFKTTNIISNITLEFKHVEQLKGPLCGKDRVKG